LDGLSYPWLYNVHIINANAEKVYYQIENLPPKWQTEDWLTFLVLCRNYFNSVKQQGFQTTKKENNFSQHSVDRLTHKKKVKEWFLNPVKYCKEIALEQHS
jgi:hypothetical protein